MKRTGKESAVVVEKAVKELNQRIKAFMPKSEKEDILYEVSIKYKVKESHLRKVFAQI